MGKTGNGSHKKTSKEKEGAPSVLPISKSSSLDQRGKVTNTSNEPSVQYDPSCLDKGKGKEVPTAKEEFDDLNCSRPELKAKILIYTTRPFEVHREILRHCYLSYLQLHPPYKAPHALENGE